MNHSVKNPVPLHHGGEPGIKTAVVEKKLAGSFIVMFPDGTREARKVFSCLVDPQINDRVLCTGCDEGIWYILAIIERPERTDMALSFPGNTNLNVHGGSLDIQSTSRLTLASESLNCLSDVSVHKSRDFVFASDSVTATGNEVQANFKTIRIISRLINTMARQVIERFKGYVRHTESGDMVKAGQMTRNTKGLYALDSEHTIMNSKGSTKIDGDKILMG